MNTRSIRVLCVDDSIDLTSALGRLIEAQSDLANAGALRNADHLLAEVERSGANVVLIDLTMPGTPPLEAIREIATSAPWCRIVAYSGYDDPETVASAIGAGACACVSKTTMPLEVLDAIRRAACQHAV